MKLGLIGTGWIVSDFIKSMREIKGVEIYAVYSRTSEKGENFARENNVKHVYTNYEEMLEHIDLIYIASPNSLHFKYAEIALKNRVHTICEKPITSNLNELTKLIKLSRMTNTALMEAIIPISMPSYKSIKENLCKIGEIRNVIFSFCQYSSKYDLYLNGETPNIFNPKFSTGALMDIGIYCVYPAIDLFGIPQNIKSSATYLKNEVDGSGVSILSYENFNVTIVYSKIHNSHIKSEIMGEEGSIVIDYISKPNKVELYKNNGDREILFDSNNKLNMYYESKEFINTVENKKIESEINSHELSINVMKTLDAIRQKLNIEFDADKTKK
ncbi:MAG: Gfo/Idh/MocA family oxidoreductase [Peptostreptococcaceae bacterium]